MTKRTWSVDGDVTVDELRDLLRKLRQMFPETYALRRTQDPNWKRRPRSVAKKQPEAGPLALPEPRHSNQDPHS